MPRICWGGVTILCLGLAGCDDGPAGPAHAVPGTPPARGRTTSTPNGPAPAEPLTVGDHLASPPQVSTPARYDGLTVAEWGARLTDPDREVAWRAALALRVLGSDGRPYLMKALESSNSQTRFIALESLALSDFRSYGEDGRRLLIKLSGDRLDFRIRERAVMYLAQWRDSTPAP
jgi:hypothetical protein